MAQTPNERKTEGAHLSAEGYLDEMTSKKGNSPSLPDDNIDDAKGKGSILKKHGDMKNPASLIDKVIQLKKRSAEDDSHLSSIEKKNGTKICDSSRKEVDEREKTKFENFKEKYCALKDETANLPYTKLVDNNYMTCAFTTEFDQYNIVYHMYQFESCFFYLERAGKSVAINTEAQCECFTDFTLPQNGMGRTSYDYDEMAFVSYGDDFINCISEQQCLCKVYSCVARDEKKRELKKETEDYCEGYKNVKKRLSCKAAEGHKFNKQIRCKFEEDPLPFETKIVCPRIKSLVSADMFKEMSEDSSTALALGINTNVLFIVISFLVIIVFYLWGMMRRRMNQRMNLK